MTIKINRIGINTLAVTNELNDRVELTRSELEGLLDDVRPSSSGTIILPRDFDKNTASVTRDRWDGGKLRAVLAALPEGKRVHIVTDQMTGHTSFNVELLRVTGPTAISDSHDRLVVRFHHHVGDGEPGYHDTAYSVLSLGALMVPAESAVKWEALKFWRDECSAAMYVAMPIAEARHGQNYGRWDMHLTRRGVHVRYEPQRPEAGPKGYGEVVDGELTSWATYGGYVGPHGSYRDLPTTAI